MAGEECTLVAFRVGVSVVFRDAAGVKGWDDSPLSEVDLLLSVGVVTLLSGIELLLSEAGVVEGVGAVGWLGSVDLQSSDAAGLLLQADADDVTTVLVWAAWLELHTAASLAVASVPSAVAKPTDVAAPMVALCGVQGVARASDSSFNTPASQLTSGCTTVHADSGRGAAALVVS